jgi:hypothetical protein
MIVVITEDIRRMLSLHTASALVRHPGLREGSPLRPHPRRVTCSSSGARTSEQQALISSEPATFFTTPHATILGAGAGFEAPTSGPAVLDRVGSLRAPAIVAAYDAEAAGGACPGRR